MRSLVPCLAILVIAGPLLAADDLESSFTSLKQAVESKKDPAEVKKLAIDTCALAHKAEAVPEPEAAAEKETWKQRNERARGIESYTEYALYSSASQAQPAAAADLMAALEEQNPKSKYLDLGYARYLNALNQSGAAAKAPAVAEKALANFPENQDLLLLLANTSLQNKQPDRALDYAKRLVAVIDKHPAKPEGVSDEEWTKKENTALGIGHWIEGIVYAGKTNHAETNVELRAALPLISGNNALMGPALFYLGVANYNLGKAARKKAQVLEAVKYSQQASAIPGAYAQQSRRNALAMKGEADQMR